MTFTEEMRQRLTEAVVNSREPSDSDSDNKTIGDVLKLLKNSSILKLHEVIVSESKKIQNKIDNQKETHPKETHPKETQEKNTENKKKDESNDKYTSPKFWGSITNSLTGMTSKIIKTVNKETTDIKKEVKLNAKKSGGIFSFLNNSFKGVFKFITRMDFFIKMSKLFTGLVTFLSFMFMPPFIGLLIVGSIVIGMMIKNPKFASFLIEKIKSIWEFIQPYLIQFTEWLVENIPVAIEKIVESFPIIWDIIWSNKEVIGAFLVGYMVINLLSLLPGLFLNTILPVFFKTLFWPLLKVIFKTLLWPLFKVILLSAGKFLLALLSAIPVIGWALLALGGLIYYFRDDLKPLFDWIWDSFKTAWVWWTENFVWFFEKIGEFFTWVWGGFIDNITLLLTNPIEFFKEVFTSFIPMIWGKLMEFGKWLISFIPGAQKLMDTADEYKTLREEGRGRAYSFFASAGVFLGLRKSRAQSGREKEAAAKSTDLKIIVQSFNDSMAKLLAIEGAIAGLSRKKTLAKVLKSHYSKNAPDKDAIKRYIDFIYKKGGFTVGSLVNLLYPNWLLSASNAPGGGPLDHLKGLSIIDAYDTTIADDAPSKGKESKNFETILESILGKVTDSGKTINSLDVGNIDNKDFIGITPLALGGIATIPTLTYIAEAGSNEAVIPLNERGVEFMKKTMLSALRSLNDGEISKLYPKNFEILLKSILGKVIDSGKTINSLDVGNINNKDFIGITPLDLGGIATIPTLTYIAEAGSNEDVIPLNERGVEFMKKTMLSALRSLNDGEISKLLTESEISENRIEKKVDSLSDNIRLLVQSISSNRSSNTVVENGSPDIVSDFTKMLASGVIGNRNGGI